MKKLLSAIGIVCFLSASAQQDTITFMSLNLLNYPNGCGTSIVNREDTLRKITQYVNPDIFAVCELQEEFGADSILNKSLNVYGTNHYSRANYIPNASSSNNLQNMLFYNSDKLILESQDEIITSLRDINHYVLYVNDPFLSVHQDTIYFEVYVCHLKAGTGSTNEAVRNDMVTLLRNYVDNRPADRNHILCGDLNAYDDQEPAYQTLTSGGGNPFVDPIGQAGNWHDNAAFAGIHTQSPRTTNWDCGATAGLDDRFDQILLTQNVMSGADSVSYLAGSYQAVGNDGQHFDTDLITPPANALYPDSIMYAVYWMSDHLPVVMDVVISKAWDDVDVALSTATPDCYGENNGSATATPSGGTSPYTYQWDAAAGNQTTQTATNLSAGNYCLTVTDLNGYTETACVTITEPALLSLTASTSGDDGSCNGEATVNVSGGTPAYTYQWEAAAGNQTTATASGLCFGDYWCIVTDLNGCQDSIQATITDLDDASISEWKDGSALLAYPNPFKDVLQIDLTPLQTKNKIEVRLLSMDGKIVFTETINEEKAGVVELHTEKIQAGEYILEIITTEKQYQIKLIKEK
ncbi:MAG: T9SS type A sorting domain-containing protein [Crocinitomicaceae bacterium]